LLAARLRRGCSFGCGTGEFLALLLNVRGSRAGGSTRLRAIATGLNGRGMLTRSGGNLAIGLIFTVVSLAPSYAALRYPGDPGSFRPATPAATLERLAKCRFEDKL
jgi:hypothetical protein